jgi:hypothetical protein
MKTIVKIILLVIGPWALAGCGGSDPKSEKEVMLEKLTANTWKISSAVVDTKQATGAFSGLEISFTNTNLTVVNEVPPLWNNATFIVEKNGQTFQLLRSDGIVMDVKEITKTNLKLQFQYYTGGKVSSVSGMYTFEFEGK